MAMAARAATVSASRSDPAVQTMGSAWGQIGGQTGAFKKMRYVEILIDWKS